ncbi:MAG: hypothetical protein IT440_11580 [Phycisphaeraceae bacterium]|nr:hypothetical protein [Phycisphaeraceae bacterium]
MSLTRFGFVGSLLIALMVLALAACDRVSSQNQATAQTAVQSSSQPRGDTSATPAKAPLPVEVVRLAQATPALPAAEEPARSDSSHVVVERVTTVRETTLTEQTRQQVGA